MPLKDNLIKLVQWLLSLDRVYKRIFVIMLDAIICISSVWIAFSLRLGMWDLWSTPMLRYTVLALAVWLPIFFLCNIYSVIFRFSGSGTMLSLMRATMIFAAIMIIVVGGVTMVGVPRTVAILHPIIFLSGLILSRIVMRYILVDIMNNFVYRGEQRNIIIYGAGSAGQQLAASLATEPSMHLIGYVDDNPNHVGQKLNNKSIYSADQIEHIVNKYEISDVIMAMPSITRTAEQAIIKKLSRIKVRVQKLPSLSKLVAGNITINDLREVSIEDLLGRLSVAPNEELMVKAVKDKIVLVSGAGGSIGGELCRQIIKWGPQKLILAEISELALYTIHQELQDIESSEEGPNIELIPTLVSVSNRPQMARLFRKLEPDIVFHAAAYKHVPLVEANPLSAMRNNILGTLNIALEAEASGVANFILISTDKAVRPTNIMGATKRSCEQILQAIVGRGSNTNFSMVRFGNVLGSSGSVVPRFMNQIKAGGPVTLTDKRITRYFMTIPEAAQLVVQAAGMAKGGDVFLLDMGSSIKILDLAKSMIGLSGLSVKSTDNPDGDIEIIEVGLRPGEKLYEELLIGDNPQQTDHDQIMKANEDYIKWDILAAMIGELESNIEKGKSKAAIAILQKMVPEFNWRP